MYTEREIGDSILYYIIFQQNACNNVLNVDKWKISDLLSLPFLNTIPFIDEMRNSKQLR